MVSLVKLMDPYNNTYHHSINKKPINTDYSTLTEKIETNHKAPKFKINDRVKITKYNNIFSKGYTENWLREIFFINSVLKTNPWKHKVKDLNGENNKKFLRKIIVVEYIISELLSRTRQ